MAKDTGLGAGLFVDQYDLSGDVGAVQTISGSRGVLDVTAIDKSARERLLGMKEGRIDFSAFHNPSTGQAHPVLSALPRTDVMVTYCHGSTVGNITASVMGVQLDYTGAVGSDASYVHTISVQDNTSYGLEWGQMLTTGKQTFTGAANGTSIDYGAVSTTAGAASYLHVMSFSGTSATFTVADSADNVSFTAITGLAHTAATAATKERKETALTATIRRYVRVQVTGTFTSCVAVLAFVRF